MYNATKLENQSKLSKFMDYIFSEDGVLQAQIIRKSDLAFFYDVTPRHFRRELDLIGFFHNRKLHYSVNEVKKIFEKLGEITFSDVERAQKRINKYNSEKRAQNRLKYLKK